MSPAGEVPRVLQVVLSLNPGGTERLVVEIIRRSQPVAMAVCCLDETGAWGEALQGEGVNVETLGRRAGFHPALGHRVANAAACHRANVIHCHQYSPFVYSSIARLWRPSVKIVFTEHGRLSDAPPSAKRKMANRLLAWAPHQVFAVSADLKRHIVAEGFPDQRVEVLYNGIDIGPLPDADARRRMRESLNLPPGTLVVGTIARLDPVKDLGTLIKAVALANNRVPAILLVVGDGTEREQLERVAGDAPAQVRFLGHRDDAREVLAGCDVYANSSISEGISLTILEAMAAGLPIVATRVGGTPEILDDSCGLLVPARDATALAAALSELAAQPIVRDQLGRAGRRRVEERFTLDRMIGEYREAYYRAVA
jgi:glycosyltransferase involved in cell wall biosynthesis